ncbi:Condensin-2 complex subunit H2, C-terminal [Dillenia turbinata]|uniref:Condensin-2 complex subunit H2 n=1 Tax=Dillenia turbinata TaxID=194707 RepID=A0AAN8ZDX2_9MAGN
MGNEEREDETAGGSKFHTLVQPHRDLESNWAVDLAKNLEEYLLKICSGEATAEDDEHHLSVNFAEAALLLQGSIQVYSRKVEYLYNLVLHALDFISQKSVQDQPESTSSQSADVGIHATSHDDNDPFWVSDDVPVDAKNKLDKGSGKDSILNHFVKPPANLVVLEGDCLDTTGDGGELETYLLATNDLYRDFILLDPCDASAVDDLLKGRETSGEQNGTCRSGGLSTKTKSNYHTPGRHSGGTAHKSPFVQTQDVNFNMSPQADCASNMEQDLPAHNMSETNNNDFDMGDGYAEARELDDSDDDDIDPWKPLNPHKPGNLKVKPYKRVKVHRRRNVDSSKHISVTKQFPLARMNGPISPELRAIWEAQVVAHAGQQEPKSPPPYEKLRQSLVRGVQDSSDTFCCPDDMEDNLYDDEIPEFGQPETGFAEMDVPEMNMDEVPCQPEKQNDGDYGQELNSCTNLEDLCRSHLDALLASISETEKQTEMAARVSSWKQRIEHNLEEQEARPPFDIHEYGERVLDELSIGGEGGNAMSFADIVKGQEKHDIARTFSALLQLVNNGDVDLVKPGAGEEPVCYTAVNSFHVRLLGHHKKQGGVQLQSSKKFVKFPTKKLGKGNRDKGARKNSNAAFSDSPSPVISQKSCKFAMKLGDIQRTPDGKRRRRTRLVDGK